MRIFMRRGVSSIEVVVGVTIAGIIISFAMNSLVQFSQTGRSFTVRTQALYLAEEGLEFVRYMRDEQWSNISSLPLDTVRYLEVRSDEILSTTTPEVLGEFTRSFTVQNVYRNTTTDDIVASTTGGSAADVESKYITVTVSWGAENVSLTSIVTDLAP